MSLFNKITKGIDKSKQQEITDRLSDIYQKVGVVLEENKVNFYELMDVIGFLQKDLNIKLVELLKKQGEKIKSLSKYDSDKPKEDAGEKNRQ